jgi:hypothetical protein
MYIQEAEWRHRLDFYGSGYGQVVGSCESGDKPSGSMKCREFID